MKHYYKYVDKFVIVEANLDHAGNERTQFDIKNFQNIKNKINYILVKKILPKHNNFYKKNWGPAWRRENYKEMHCLKV